MKAVLSLSPLGGRCASLMSSSSLLYIGWARKYVSAAMDRFRPGCMAGALGSPASAVESLAWVANSFHVGTAAARAAPNAAGKLCLVGCISSLPAPLRTAASARIPISHRFMSYQTCFFAFARFAALVVRWFGAWFRPPRVLSFVGVFRGLGGTVPLVVLYGRRRGRETRTG